MRRVQIRTLAVAALLCTGCGDSTGSGDRLPEALQCARASTLRENRPASGMLESGDCTVGGGALVDYYRVEFQTVRRVDITVSSGDFDAALAVLTDAGAQIASADDASDTVTDAKLRIQLRSGTYYIAASSSGAGAGAYTIAVTTAPAAASD